MGALEKDSTQASKPESAQGSESEPTQVHPTESARVRQAKLRENVASATESAAADFFDKKLRALNLAIDQLEKQTLPQLEKSLQTINDAMQHPDQFGTFRMKMTTDSPIWIIKSTAEAEVEVGILPILLERKSLILDRIKLLRPEGQLAELRKEISQRVSDSSTRNELLHVIDKQHEEQQEFSSKLEIESKQVDQALQAERQAAGQAILVAKLEMRIDALDKSLETRVETLDKELTRLDKELTQLEEKSVSKWDVVTTLFATLAALGGLVGVVLGIVKWVTG
jgi:hypothetical protein